MSRDQETVSFEGVTVKRETDMALLCVIEDKEHWVPKSVIHDDSEVYKMDTEGVLVLPEWWAVKEGLV
jgi:hypothetical protein